MTFSPVRPIGIQSFSLQIPRLLIVNHLDGSSVRRPAETSDDNVWAMVDGLMNRKRRFAFIL